MSNFALLNSETHRGLKVRPDAAAKYGDNQRFVSVIPAEFPLLAVHYPILIAKDAVTGELALGALLGFDENENLFLTDKGMDSYRPLNLQRGCFFAANDQPNKAPQCFVRLVDCIIPRATSSHFCSACSGLRR